MFQKKDNSIIIRAKGPLFIFAATFLGVMLAGGIITISLTYLWFNKSFSLSYSIIAIIILVIGIPLFIYDYIYLFKEAKVIFQDNNFITEGHRNKTFRKINKDCKDIISYKQTYKQLSQCIEFTLSNNKIVNFQTMQYTRNQVLRILSEIKKRGGLQNQEIELSK